LRRDGVSEKASLKLGVGGKGGWNDMGGERTQWNAEIVGRSRKKLKYE